VLDFDADLVAEGEDGKVHLENISRFVIDRANRDPLVVSAELGDYEGEAGERIIVFRRAVVIRDLAEGLVLTLPGLVVDEAAGEARSTEAISLEGPSMVGRAGTLVYGLHGQPTELSDPELQNADGLVVTARTAVLLDGLDDVEFRGEVQATRGPERFSAERLRWNRDEEGRLRQAEATGQPAAATVLAGEVPAEVRGNRLDASWDEEGEIESFALDGEALVQQEGSSIAAATLDVRRRSGSPDWGVEARGTVYATVLRSEGSAWLRADHLDGDFDSELRLRVARASGQVRFGGPGTSAEADRAAFRPGVETGEIRLQAVERPKARLAREQIRVAAERITTDPQGRGLVAEEGVEATLLPAKDGRGPGVAGAMFRVEEAVHFVSARLEAETRVGGYTFSGSVRGWQGERNLSAETVVLSQREQRLTASGAVTTRIPRDTERPTLSEADYVQIGADLLVYEEATGLAVYRGNVRVRLAEGWMEADRMEVQLGEEGGRISAVNAFDRVRIEFRDTGDGGAPRLIGGSGDRLEYDPRVETVRLFGDETPAAVRRIGEQGGTTTGRVLRYRLDLGTLEVDAGEPGPARIRTNGE
jgi:lipopolysaccharide transport protein LptA